VSRKYSPFQHSRGATGRYFHPTEKVWIIGAGTKWQIVERDPGGGWITERARSLIEAVEAFKAREK
jgi:hypothetical protein